MKPAKWCAYILHAALLIPACFAQSAPSLLPSPAPGLYNRPCMVSFPAVPGTRLSLYLDDAPLAAGSSTVYLEGAEGDERSYSVRAELSPIEPGRPLLASALFSWTIDRKKPERPLLTASPVEGGRMVSMSLSGSGSIRYSMYHRFTGTVALDDAMPGDSLFVPHEAVLCAFAVDPAGNRGPAASYAAPPAGDNRSPFRVLNPVPGIWANNQTLLIESAPGTVVMWSADGSDPTISGMIYDGPVQLETEGVSSVRIAARDETGKLWSEQILYSVVEAPVPPLGSYAESRAVLETGDFYELPVPEGLLYSIGDAVPVLHGGKNILFSAVRGMVRYFPLTLSDGTSVWRIVCSSGRSGSNSGTGAVRAVPSLEEPAVAVHGWHFISIDYRYPVFYSIDGASWSEYSGPVFSEREKDSVLRWYSPEWKGGEIQSLRLPPVPRVSGIPENEMTSGPVFLSVPDSPYECTYAVGSVFSPERPSPGSPELASGLLFEVPSGSSSSFKVRILASVDGLVHGELTADFLIDRKTPRVPSVGIEPRLVWSRSPVRFTPSGEDMLHVSITPDLYVRDGNSFILTGAEGKKISYSVSVSASDQVGNRSEEAKRELTVDLGALYVDSSSSGPGDGSPAAPFTNLDDALETVRNRSLWRLYVSGRAEMNRRHTLLSDIELYGTDAEIIAGPNATLVVSGSTLSLQSCTIKQTIAGSASDRKRMSVSASSVPLLDLQNAVLKAVDCNFSSAGHQIFSLIRSSGSTVSLSGCFVSLQASEYVSAIDAKRSQITVSDSDFSCTAHDTVAISLASSFARTGTSRFSVAPLLSGRIFEAWDSSIILETVVLERSESPGGNRDSAIFLDAKSSIVSEKAVSNNGFWKRDSKGSR